MLIKKFVPRALMQERQQTDLLSDGLELVGQLGYMVLNPTFCSSVANVSTEQTHLQNFVFYHSKKMKWSEKKVADKLTVALQEAFIQNNLYDVRGLGTKVQYSKLYGSSYEWVEIPKIKIKYKWISKKSYDYTSCLVLKDLSSSVYSKLVAHDYYVDELNQALKRVKNCTLLAPSVNSKGWLIYPLVDNTANNRFSFKTVNDLKKKLKETKSFEIPLTPSITYNPSEYANILLAGSVGGGKSYTCLSLLCMMALQGFSLYVIDGKDADLAFVGKQFLPEGHTAVNGEDALDLLRNYVNSMDLTYVQMDKLRKKAPQNHLMSDFRSYNMKPKFLFIDEFASIQTQLNPKQKKEAAALLKQLILKNRQSGCFVCLATQQPNSKILDTDVRDNLMLRIFLGQPKTEVKTMMFGAGAVLPEKAVDGKGVGYIQFADKDDISVFHSATLPESSNDLYEFVKECLKNQV